jgi:hypothetical protein
MSGTESKSLGIALVALALLVGVSSSEAAVKRITQNKVNNGSVSPGDAPGFPATISQPGSYILMSNLVLPATPGTVGIEVTAQSVEIDLNGFAIIGPKQCPDADNTPCPPGIEDPTFHLIKGGDNVTVKNGTARGSGGNGITLGAHARIENMKVLWNALFGVTTAQGSLVKDSLAAQNGEGIHTGADCLITGNIVRANTFAGLDISSTNCGYRENIIGCTGPSCVFGGINLGGNICNGGVCP